LPQPNFLAYSLGMNVTCPQCKARYNLTAAQIGPSGRSLKCARCGHQWFVAPEVQGPASEPGAEVGPGDNTPDGDATPPLPPANGLGLDELAYVGQTPGWNRRYGMRLLVWLSAAVVLLGAGLGIALWLLLTQPNAPLATGPAAITDPQPAGLVLSDLKRDVQQDGSLVILRFTGNVTNTGNNVATLPEIRVQLLDAKGIELDFWPAEVEKPTLQPGETTHWSVRFLNPQLDRIATFRAFFKTTGNRLTPAAVHNTPASPTTVPSATAPANPGGPIED
jgi:predicted Zn finger-like uncharacterized protein